MSYVRLTFVGGPRDGETRTFPHDQLLPQDAFDGYWIEDMILDNELCAVPLDQAVLRGWS